VIASERSAEGIVGGTRFAEGPNIGKDATTRKPRTGHTAENPGDLAFGATGKGESRTAPLEGTAAGAAESVVYASSAGVKERPRSIQ